MYTSYKEEETNNSKRNILIISLIVVALIFVTLYFLFKDSSKYIIINNASIFKYEDNKLLRLGVNDKPSSRQRYMMYYQDEHIGNYYINNDMDEAEWFFYHKTKSESYTFHTPYIALSTGINYVKYEKTSLNDSDIEELKELVGVDNLDQSLLLPAYKVYKDIDNDGNDEIIYCVSYRDNEDITKSYSFVYAKKEGVIYNIVKLNGSINDGEEVFGQYNLGFIIDINRDYNYELVIEYSDYDISDYSIYKMENDTFINMEESE